MNARIAKCILSVSVFFLAFGWLVFLFSAIGLFYRETIILSIGVSLIIFLYISQKKILQFSQKPGKISVFVVLAAFAASFFTCYFATPTVFGGRDQGSIATAAIELSKNHALEISDPVAHDLFQKYGAGRSLNFPGFDYTKDGDLISRFPVGYTSYLAAFYNFFGLKGIQYANLIPLFLFFAIFWLTLREFFNEKISFLGFLLAATFFPFLWFAKYALTEIYMLFLVWAGIYFLISARKGSVPAIAAVTISAAFFALSAFIRIEGAMFFLLFVAYVVIASRKKTIELPKNFFKYLFVSALFALCFYALLNFPALSDSLKNVGKAFLANSGKESAPSSSLYSYLFKVFFSYNILAFIVLGLAGVFWLVAGFRKNWAKPEFLPIFLVFPAFFYLLSPQITLDDPWLLRRFVFAVFPALIFYSICALNRFFHHKIFLHIVLVALVVANSAISWRFLERSENKELLGQIEKISQKFGDDDLILVDRLATGSGFSLMSEPLRTIFKKNAVYFFNPEDLEYIDQKRHENIYLVGPPAEKDAWYAELVKNKPFEGSLVINNFLEPAEKAYSPAQNVNFKDFTVIWKIK